MYQSGDKQSSAADSFKQGDSERSKSQIFTMVTSVGGFAEEEAMKRQREEILAERDRIKREKTKEECEMCQKKFKGFMSKAKFCVFCNRYVCSEHMVKKREDPGVLGEFVEICAQCEDKILYDKLMKKYQDAENILEEREQKYKTKLASIEEQLRNNQDEFDRLVKEQEKQNRLHEQRLEKYNALLMEGQQRLRDLEEEAETLHNHYEKLIERNKAIEVEKSQYQSEYEQVRLESQALTYQLSAIELDIKQVTYVINEAEKKIARHKIGMQQQENERLPQQQQQQQNANEENSYVQINSILASLNQKKFQEKNPKFKKDGKMDNKGYYCI